jgi:hypothetical protein
MKKGTLQWEQGFPVMKTCFSLWELTYREFPVSLGGFGFAVYHQKCIKFQTSIFPFVFCLNLTLILYNSKPQNQMFDWTQVFFFKVKILTFPHDSRTWFWCFFTFLVALAHSVPLTLHLIVLLNLLFMALFFTMGRSPSWSPHKLSIYTVCTKKKKEMWKSKHWNNSLFCLWKIARAFFFPWCRFHFSSFFSSCSLGVLISNRNISLLKEIQPLS